MSRGEEGVLRKGAVKLRIEGFSGVVASVKGLDLTPEGLTLKQDLHLRRFSEI